MLLRPLLRSLPTSTRRAFSSSSTAAAELDPRLLASSFCHWFRRLPPSDLDPIFRALSSPSPSSSLSSLRLRLDDRLVLRVLRHHATPLPLKLHFFDWASRHPFYRPSPAAHHAVLLLLARSRHSPLAVEWLRLYSASSPRRPFFHHILVAAYAATSRPDAALRALARMRFIGLDLNPPAYHLLLRSLVRARLFNAADTLARQIADRGFAGSTTAFLRVESLCRQGRLGDARVTLTEAARDSGTHAVDRAAACLAGSLCRRGRFEEAGELVLLHGGPATESVWMRNLVSTRSLDSALEFLRRRRASGGYTQGILNYNRVVYLLLRQGRLEEVYDVLTEIEKSGIAPNQATMNAVLSFLCRGGMVDVAIQLYNRRHEFGLTPNSVAINHLISALCGDGSLEEACTVLEQSMMQGYFPRKQTFQTLTDVLRRNGKLDKLSKLLEAAVQRNMVRISSARGQNVPALCRVGRTEEVYMTAMEKATAIGILSRNAYVGLIRGFIAVGRGDMVCRMLMEMQDNSHVPSRKLYRDCIRYLCEVGGLDLVFSLLQMQLSRKELDQRTCYNYFLDGFGHAKRPDLARQVFEMMRSTGIEPDFNSNILMLQCYMKGKRVGDTLKFFDDMHTAKEPSNRMYNMLIVGLCKASKPDSALMIWDEVRRKGVIPSLHCYEELVRVLFSVRNYAAIVEVIGDFEKTGRPLSPFICNSILMHSLKTESLGAAWSSYEDGKSDNKPEELQNSGIVPILPLLGNLVAAFSGRIRATRHIISLDDALKKHIPVNLTTYNALLRGLTMSRRMDDAFDLFHKMCKKGYTPNKWTYDIIIRGLCEVGRKTDAGIWMKRMYQSGFSPIGSTLNLFHHTSDD